MNYRYAQWAAPDATSLSPIILQMFYEEEVFSPKQVSKIEDIFTTAA